MRENKTERGIHNTLKNPKLSKLFLVFLISDYAKWWEFAGASFYILNPIFEFIAGSLE